MHVIKCVRRLKSVMVSAWTYDLLNWFQSTIRFYQKILNCSVWAIGTKKHLVYKVW